MPAAKDPSPLRGLKSEKLMSIRFVVNGEDGARSLYPGFKVVSSGKCSDPACKRRNVDVALYVGSEAATDGHPPLAKVRPLIEFERGGKRNDPFEGITGAAAAEERREAFKHQRDYKANAFECSPSSAEQEGFDSTVAAVSSEEHELMDALAVENSCDLSDAEGAEVPPCAPEDPPYVFAYVRHLFTHLLNDDWTRPATRPPPRVSESGSLR
ncbi:hypothetical protein BD413DRAFT_489610 [Trametes elegans]|nr:hypothetical protein BD413DRAFT_489610 [Trametes elegans]